MTHSFKLMVITAPQFVDGEHELIRQLFAEGLNRIHVRKPEMCKSELIDYVSFFTAGEREKMRVHCKAETIVAKSGINGRHLPFNQAVGLEKINCSTSVHSWDEYGLLPGRCDYAFISPLFDSISKKGYLQSKELWNVPSQKNVPAIGLGGINSQNIHQVMAAGFDGAALLGAIWQNPQHAVRNFKLIVKKAEQYA